MSEVTVFVPSYNHARFVERTLRSIFAQTLAPKKLIVIDDGSKDESVAVIERVLRGCPFRHEFIARENRGLCATLNEGFARSDGDYFAYISSDDLWLPGFLESRAGLLDRRPGAALSYGYAYLVDEHDRITDSTADWGEYADGNALRMLLHPMIPTSASVVYRAEFLRDGGWNEDSILEDYELYLRLAARGEFALDRGEPLSAWRIHDNNTSRDFPRMMNEWLAAQRRTMIETGLSEVELETAQTKLKFRCVKDFVRHGRRREALGLFLANRRGADSFGELAGSALRLLIPAFVWSRRVAKGPVITELIPDNR